MWKSIANQIKKQSAHRTRCSKCNIRIKIERSDRGYQYHYPLICWACAAAATLLVNWLVNCVNGEQDGLMSCHYYHSTHRRHDCSEFAVLFLNNFFHPVEVHSIWKGSLKQHLNSDISFWIIFLHIWLWTFLQHWQLRCCWLLACLWRQRHL